MKTIEERAYDYVSKTHSQTDNDFQNAMNIAVAKGYIRGAKEQIEFDKNLMTEIIYNLVEIGDIEVKDIKKVVELINNKFVYL